MERGSIDKDREDRLNITIGDLIYDKTYKEHLLVLDISSTGVKWLVLETGLEDWDICSHVTTKEFQIL